MKQTVILILIGALLVSSCAGMSSTEQRMLSGGAIGASSGALIGWAAGSPAVGAAVGGGAGVVGGLIYDQFQKQRGRY